MANELTSQQIGFLGGGAMAEALIGAVRAAGAPAKQIRVADPSSERRNYLETTFGVQAFRDNAEVASTSDLVILAIKPNLVVDVLHTLATDPNIPLERPLWISIAAGMTLSRICKALPVSARVLRAMPNTPALVRAGATAFFANPNCTARDRALATTLFEAVGIAWEAPGEELLDAVTGLSGSGPAYVFYFLMELVSAGESVGLPHAAAERLAFQTVLGAAKMALETGVAPQELKARVTSPGGTTMAGLQCLEDGRLRAALHDAVTAATKRSKELGQN